MYELIVRALSELNTRTLSELIVRALSELIVRALYELIVCGVCAHHMRCLGASCALLQGIVCLASRAYRVRLIKVHTGNKILLYMSCKRY